MTSPAIAGVLSDFIREAEQLRHENERLRAIATELLVRLARRHDLEEFAAEALEQRWAEAA